jgi:hypothetical protein
VARTEYVMKKRKGLVSQDLLLATNRNYVSHYLNLNSQHNLDSGQKKPAKKAGFLFPETSISLRGSSRATSTNLIEG